MQKYKHKPNANKPCTIAIFADSIRSVTQPTGRDCTLWDVFWRVFGSILADSVIRDTTTRRRTSNISYWYKCNKKFDYAEPTLQTCTRLDTQPTGRDCTLWDVFWRVLSSFSTDSVTRDTTTRYQVRVTLTLAQIAKFRLCRVNYLSRDLTRNAINWSRLHTLRCVTTSVEQVFRR